jgi:thiol-disulfide isomerase/thioredoxin
MFAGCKPAVEEAKIHGSIQGQSGDVVEMYYDGYASAVYRNNDIRIELDSTGSFNVALSIDAPAYYRLGSNTIYLTPGCDLEVDMAQAASKSTFEGVDAEANGYLAGIRWSDSRNMGYGFGDMPTLEDISLKADSLEQIRRGQLSSLTGVDREFVDRESARIVADRIKLIFDNFYRTEYYKWDDPQPVVEQKKIDYYRSIVEQLNPMLAMIDRDEALLDVASVREVLLECFNAGCFDMNVTPLLKELGEAVKMAKEMDKGITLANRALFEDHAATINDGRIKEAYLAKLDTRMRLMEGAPAPDTELRDKDDNLHRLSEHRGRPLFIDVWATWCLPCLAQSPKFLELSEEYPEITFIGMSIDQNVDSWKKKLASDGEHATITEYIADAYAAYDDWDLAVIPRFLLIDRDFNIVTAFSPRPSEPDDLIPLLDRLAGRSVK